MALKNLERRINVIIKVYKKIPKSIIIDFIILFIKLLPLFIFTHDYNINHGKGISYILRKATLVEIFADIQNKSILHSITIFLLIIAIIIITSLIIIFNNAKNYEKLKRTKKVALKIITFILFFIFYLCNQYIYSLITEELFCPAIVVYNQFEMKLVSDNECKGVFYYCIAIIIGILGIMTMFISMSVNNLYNDIIFRSDCIHVTYLNKINLTLVIIPLFQILLQLEFHLDYFTMMDIKTSFRIIYVVIYLSDFYTLSSFFSSYYTYYCLKLFYSMCFVSCIIEWCFCYDFNNHMTILLKNPCFIIIKIIVEILLGRLLIELYIKREKHQLHYLMISCLKIDKQVNLLTMQKLLFCIYYRYIHPNPFYYVSLVALETFKANSHAPLCHKDCLFCITFTDKEYKTQLKNTIDAFIDDKIEYAEGSFLISKNGQHLKQTFPLMHSLLHMIIIRNLHKNNKGDLHNKGIEALLICAMFYYTFEGNHYKSLFYIEQITKTKVYQESVLLKLQINIFRYKITCNYKKYRDIVMNENELTQVLNDTPYKKQHLGSDYNNIRYHSIKEMHVDYKCIEKIIKGEKLLMKSMNDYMKIVQLMSNEVITYKNFYKEIHRFCLGYKLNQVNIHSLFEDGSWSSLPYSSEKFWLYYGYFGHKKNTKAIEAIRKYFNQNLLCIEYIKENNHIIVFNAALIKEKIAYTIEYLSDSLLTLLKYPPSSEYKIIHFNDLLSKQFIKPYTHYLTQCIKNGNDRIVINNFCLMDKDQYILLFNFTGVALYSQNTIKIFVEIEEANNHQISINKTNQKPIKEGRNIGKNNQDNTSNNYCGTCFLFTKLTGRITSICRDFDTMFYLSSSIIQKYNINIKEILHIEQLSKEGTFERDLIQVFQNIINLNITQIGSSGEDDFSMQIILLKEVLEIVNSFHQTFTLVIKYEEKQLYKNDKRIKRYYFFILSIRSSNVNGMDKKNSDMVFLKKISKNNLVYGNIAEKNDSNNNRDNDMSSQHKYNPMKSAIENEEMFNLIVLIKLMSLKFISLKYRIESRNRAIRTEIKKIEYNTTSSIKPLLNSIGNNSKKTIEENNKKQLFLTTKLTKNLMKIEKYFPIYTFGEKYYSFLFASMTLTALVILTLSKISAAEEQKYFFHSLSYLELSRNCVTWLLSTILYMLFQGNNLQEKTIDNGKFNNSFEYYKTTFDTGLADLNNYQGLLRPFLYEYSQTFHPIFKDCLMGKFPVLYLNINNKASSKNESFGDLHFIGIMLRELEKSNPVQVYFNRTDDLYVELGKNKDFYAEAAYVKLIENYITTNKYFYLELINSFPDTIIAPQFHSRIWISIACLCFTIGLSLVGLFVMITHIKYLSHLFAKYLITFIEFRFFQDYLEKKTHLISHYIQNYSIKKNLKGSILLDYQHEKMNVYRLIEYITENPKASIKISAFYPIQRQPLIHDTIDSPKNICSYHNSSIGKRVNEGNDSNALPSSSVILRQQGRSNTNTKSNAGVLGLIKSKAELKASITLSPINIDDLLKLTNDKETENFSEKENNVKSKRKSSQRRKSIFYNNNLNNNPLSISSNIKLLNNIQNNANYNPNVNGSINCNQSINMSSGNCLPTSTSINTIKISSYFSNGKSLLNEANEYIAAWILLSISFILLILCGIYNILGTYKNRDDLLQMFVGEFSVFNQINFVSEMILAYQISVLKNKELKFDYVSHGYIHNCPETEYANNLITHNIFEELESCYYSTRNILVGIINGNFHYGLQNLGTYQKMIDTDDFCITYSQFFSKSKSLPKEYDLFLVGKESEEILLHECQIIGDGFNSKGITNVLDSMHTNIVILYNEFKSDSNRTEESNYARLNNKYIQTFQAEILTVLHKIPMHYIISLLMDYEYLYTQLQLESYLLAIGEVILVLLIAIQFMLLIYKYNRENHDIEFLEGCLLKTILF